MKKKVHYLLFYYCFLFLGLLQTRAQEEVLYSSPAIVRESHPHLFSWNITTITNTKKVILGKNFGLDHKSSITRFNFVGQLGNPATAETTIITGAYLFVFKNYRPDDIPFSETSAAVFEEIVQGPGLIVTREGERTLISLDMALLGKELVLEEGTYFLAFAPVIATDGLPADKIWYWYDGDRGGLDALQWTDGDTRWSVSNVNDVAFSIEGKKYRLSTPEFESGGITKVFPNPSDGIVTVTSEKDIVAIRVYNAKGQLLLKSTSAQIDLSAFPAGIYTVAVTDDTGTVSRKQIIKK